MDRTAVVDHPDELNRAARERIASSHPMTMLGAGVPLSLLFDLLGMDLGTSRAIARDERADSDWVHHAA